MEITVVAIFAQLVMYQCVDCSGDMGIYNTCSNILSSNTVALMCYLMLVILVLPS